MHSYWNLLLLEQVVDVLQEQNLFKIDSYHPNPNTSSAP
jgi:hypothetical protein